MFDKKAKKYYELGPFKDKRAHCSFCGKSQYQITTLIPEDCVYVCSLCIEQFSDMLSGYLINKTKISKTCMQLCRWSSKTDTRLLYIMSAQLYLKTIMESNKNE